MQVRHASERVQNAFDIKRGCLRNFIDSREDSSMSSDQLKPKSSAWINENETLNDAVKRNVFVASKPSFSAFDLIGFSIRSQIFALIHNRSLLLSFLLPKQMFSEHAIECFMASRSVHLKDVSLTC